MKPFSMNLSKFKKIAQDSMSTTLKDPNGHEIKIVHSKLPAIQKKQLEGLPMAFADAGAVGDMDDIPIASLQAPADPSTPAQLAQAPVEPHLPATPQNANLLASDQTLNAPEAVKLEQSAARQQQAIDSAKGVETANIEKGYNDQKAILAQQEQNNINAVKQHADEFSDWITKNPINSKHYQESMSSGQKVVNALGLLAGGIGQGAVGGSNPAMDFLNAQIDRDVAAQKANVDNKKSIYGAYQQLYGDQLAATTAAKASLIDVYNHKMQLLAAKLGTPQAKAAADAFAAKAAIERNQLLLDTAGRLGQLNTGQVLGQAAPAGGENVASAQGTSGASASWEGNNVAASDAERLQNAPGVFGKMYSAVVGGGDRTGSQAGNPPSKKDYFESHILHPNAAKKWLSMPHEMKAKGAAEQIPALTHQFNQATQAEKGLQIVDPTIDRLYGYAKEGGAGGRFERAIHQVRNIPYVGQGAEAIWSAAGDDPTTRAYLADQQALFGSISAALKGTNVGDNSIHEIVNANLPDPSDSDAAIKAKKENIKHFIKLHTDTSLLKSHGYAPE